jgi:hypothetical protein
MEKLDHDLELCLTLISVQKQMFDLLEGWLRHKSNMVNLEAARAICEMKNVTAAQAAKAISGTVRFLASWSKASEAHASWLSAANISFFT